MTLTDPSISVIIPTYNGEKYILETLRSILAQSLPPNEIIVSDDRSSDNTITLVKSLAESSSVMIKLVTASADGISNNYLNALKHTSCELIIVGDHDDFWQPNKIQVIANKFASDSSLTILSSDSSVVDENLTPRGTTLRGGIALSKKLSALCEKNDFQQFLQGLRLDAHTLAFKASLKELVFSEPFNVIEQFWFENKIAIAGMATGKLAYLGDSLTLYRQHASQHIGATHTVKITGSNNVDRSRDAKLELLLALLKDKNLPNRVLRPEQAADRAEMLQDYLAFVRTRQPKARKLASISVLMKNLVRGRYYLFTRRSALSFAKDLVQIFR